MRRKCSASPSGSGARCVPWCKYDIGRPWLWTIEHESQPRGHRQSCRDANTGRMPTNHRPQRQFSCSAAPARPAAAWPSACAARGRRCASARARPSPPSTGTTAPPGRPRWRARRRPTSPSTPTSPCPVRRRPSPPWPSRPWRGGTAPARAAVRSRRGGGPARRAGSCGVGRRLDRGAVLAGSCRTSARPTSLDPLLAGELALPADERAGAVRGRRRHRRRGGGRADRGRPRRPRLRADRPAALTFAEAVAEIAAATGRDLGYRTSRWPTSRPGWPPAASRPTWSSCCATCSQRSTPATPPCRRRAAGAGPRPRDFADFAREAAAAGAWDPTAARAA